MLFMARINRSTVYNPTLSKGRNYLSCESVNIRQTINVNQHSFIYNIEHALGTDVDRSTTSSNPTETSTAASRVAIHHAKVATAVLQRALHL